MVQGNSVKFQNQKENKKHNLIILNPKKNSMKTIVLLIKINK